MALNAHYDVVIVGAGISGALIAKRLGAAGKTVLILEAGLDGQGSYADYLERFYLAQAKVPESPYDPPIAVANKDGIQAPSDPSGMAVGRPTTLMLGSNWKDPTQAYLDQQGPLAFASTYERGGGGTMRHWLGTSLRFVPNDFKVKSTYGVEEDWPIRYEDLEPWYCQAEAEIGVAAAVDDQGYHGIHFTPGYQYPMPPIPNSLVDQAVTVGLAGLPPIEGIKLEVSNTPAGRNSIPYQNRRQCAGNTNCIPICPIQAKYDPTVTLADALQFPTVTIQYQTVASEILVGSGDQVSAINFLTYVDPDGPATGRGSVSATRYVIAAHAIETPRLLLMSTNQGRTPNGVANSSGHVGQHLMDHPIYLSWARTKEPVFGYRGPLSTAGIESMRDGAFRSKHAAFRIEIGNEGWNFPIGDPYTTTIDMVLGTNVSRLNPDGKPLFGADLVNDLNGALTRQFRLGFLMEQTPDDDCDVTLSPRFKDRLGLPRPRISYNFSDYTKMGFVAARRVATQIYAAMGAEEFTQAADKSWLGEIPTSFSVTYDANDVPVPSGTAPPNGSTTEYFQYFGAGHVVGTYRMGTDKTSSVVNAEQRSWDHANLFLVGSGVFPTVATGNPTLTLAALALWASKTILAELK
ncbi:MAG TPA: GMC family oxidoreductase [Allosphingosinicella sp.]|jgi:choline dehydrogenase-like flavoprotein